MHRSHLVDWETDLWVCVRSPAGQEERQSDRPATGDDDNCDDDDGDGNGYNCDGDDGVVTIVMSKMVTLMGVGRPGDLSLDSDRPLVINQ